MSASIGQLSEAFLCGPCQSSLRNSAEISVSSATSGRIRQGIRIAKLGLTEGPWSTSTCNLCQLLYSTRLSHSQSPYELRAFSFLRSYDGIYYDRIDSQCGLKDSIILAAVPATFHESLHGQKLRSHLWKNGHLVLGTNVEQNFSSSIANVVPSRFDPQFLLHSLDYCNTHHKKLCQAPVDIPKTKLIDCYNRSYIFSTEHTKYAALSYV